MSLRVSTPKAFISACSGLMYSNVPTRAPNWVNSVRSVSRCSIALATPKSITLGTGLSSYMVTRTFDGLMSRWMIPFWCACWIAWQTGTNSSRRSRGVSWASSQNLVIGTPCTSSMTKYGRPVSVVPASKTLAMWVWSITARRLALGFEPRDDLGAVHPRLDDLSATLRRTGCSCSAM